MMVFLDIGYAFAIKNGGSHSKFQNILQVKKTYDLAFFGSSRTKNHIDCKLITQLTGKSCINFGIGGASNGDMLILMKLAKNRKLIFNQVFMQVDYNYNYYEITEDFKSKLVGPLISDPIVKEQLYKYGEDYIYGLIPFYYYMKYDKIIGLREIFTSFLKSKPFSELNIEFGFTPLIGIGKAVAGSFQETINNNSEELTQMQEVYKDTNTRLEFFTAPYCKEVKNRDFMDKVQLKLPGLHNYIDLFDDKDEYFFNCGHLNKAGAAVFTKTLVEDLLQ